MICFYHNDLDGRCSAAIVHMWVGIRDCLSPVQFIEMDYNKPIPWDKIHKDEQVWIVDFSFSVEDMTSLMSITTDVTWIDHHVTAIEKFKHWPGKLRGIRQDGTAACVLTWKYIHWWTSRGDGAENFGQGCPSEGLEIPRGVAMIGDYDAWLHQIPDSTKFYEGMKLKDGTPGSNDWWNVLVEESKGARYGDGRVCPPKDICGPIIREGEACIKYRDAYCEEMNRAYGFESEIDGVKCWVANIYKFGSLGYGDRMDKYPICAAAVFDGRRWTISLYSKTVDVSLICKNHGGGGHKGAAGFVAEKFPFERKS